MMGLISVGSFHDTIFNIKIEIMLSAALTKFASFAVQLDLGLQCLLYENEDGGPPGPTYTGPATRTLTP